MGSNDLVKISDIDSIFGAPALPVDLLGRLDHMLVDGPGPKRETDAVRKAARDLDKRDAPAAIVRLFFLWVEQNIERWKRGQTMPEYPYQWALDHDTPHTTARETRIGHVLTALMDGLDEDISRGMVYCEAEYGEAMERFVKIVQPPPHAYTQGTLD